MGTIISVDDGLPAEEVGVWAKEKHQFLRRYVDISRSARKKYLGPGKAGATFIDLFCGSGRSRVRETREWIDGSAVAAWKISVEGSAPFSAVYVADIDDSLRAASAERLRQLGATVIELTGTAVDAARTAVAAVNGYGLHFAFVDPFNLAELDFSIIQSLSILKRIDILIHLSAMDLQRNLSINAAGETSAFDTFAPGWREHVDRLHSQVEMRRRVVEYWRMRVAEMGVWPSTEMRLITGSKNQPLYWLLLAAKHELAQKFWETAANVEGQGKFRF